MKIITDVIVPEFKIQYGQIYSEMEKVFMKIIYEFKIQYGQIYREKETQDSVYITHLKSNMDRFIG